MTREVQYPRCGRKGALQSIHVDAPNVDVAARLALSHHIDSRPTPPPAGTSFGLVVITPPPDDPNVPHHDLDDEAEMCHLDVEYWPPQPPCTDRPLRPEQAPRRQENRVNRPAGGTLSTTMFEQPIDTRFPGQQFPVGSVVTFLDRDRRTVFPAVTELRRHEANETIVAGGETGRYAGLRLIKAGPTGGATMQQVELSVSFRQRLTARVRQRSICPRCRSRIAWRINAYGEGR